MPPQDLAQIRLITLLIPYTNHFLLSTLFKCWSSQPSTISPSVLHNVLDLAKVHRKYHPLGFIYLVYHWPGLSRNNIGASPRRLRRWLNGHPSTHPLPVVWPRGGWGVGGGTTAPFLGMDNQGRHLQAPGVASTLDADAKLARKSFLTSFS